MPTNLCFAFTAPINPAGLTPVLSKDQVWAGLQRKIRRAYEFVTAIDTCDVLSDGGDNGEVVREVVFKFDPQKRVKEVVRSYAQLKVDFHQTDGSLISNIVSDGPSGKDEDLFMTYAFEWLNRDAEPGSEEEKQLYEKQKPAAKVAVEGSIDTIRRLVREGQI